MRLAAGFADDALRGFAFIDLCRQRYDVALRTALRRREPPSKSTSRPPTTTPRATFTKPSSNAARLVPAGYLSIISSRAGLSLSQSEDWRTRVVLRLFPPRSAILAAGARCHGQSRLYVLRSLTETETRHLTHSFVPLLEKVVRDRQDRFSLPKWQAARDGLKRHQAVAELEHLEAHGFVQRSPGTIVRYTPLWSSVTTVTAPPDPVFPLLVCIRALADVDKAEAVFDSVAGKRPDSVFVCDPARFAALPGGTFSYWASPNTLRLFRTLEPFESNGRTVKGGMKARRLPFSSPCIGAALPPISYGFLCKGGAFANIISTSTSALNGEAGEELRAYYEQISRAELGWIRSEQSDYFRPGVAAPDQWISFGLSPLAQSSATKDQRSFRQAIRACTSDHAGADEFSRFQCARGLAARSC